MANQIIIEESPVSKFLFSNTRMAWFWLIVRIYVGYEWIMAGWEKIHNPVWVGPSAGAAISGFVQGALQKMSSAHPDVSGWYGSFLQNIVLPHAAFWSHLVAWGELLVGIALVIGLLTGIAAFFGLFMNLNYLLAGTVSVNPILFTLSIGIILAWKIAGYIGFDFFVLPSLGTPWHGGTLFGRKDIIA
jgi:thiosulfate dehydrogenase [quinone] large subunit